MPQMPQERPDGITRGGPPGRTPDREPHEVAGAAAASPPDPPRIVSGEALDDAPLASRSCGAGPVGCEKPFWNPYVAGVALGLVLLASFLVMGNGLGASGAANRLGIGAAHTVAPDAMESDDYFGGYVGPGKSVLDDWLIFEVLGVFLGGVVGAYAAGRLRRGIVMGPRPLAPWKRIGLALLGGILMGIAARFARGCTSGQALSGGASLSLGSWALMFMIFIGGYLLAWPLRRFWR